MPKSPFPHMLPNDVALFAGFINTDEGRQYEMWTFDAHLGAEVDPGPAYPPEIRRASILLRCLRIDAVGWIGREPTIFEVKPDARLSAFGQLLAYCWFWREIKQLPCHRAVITDTMTDQVKTLYDAYDVGIKIVEPADSAGIQLAVNWVRPLTVVSPPILLNPPA
jgi:hypothetical protein